MATRSTTRPPRRSPPPRSPKLQKRNWKGIVHRGRRSVTAISSISSAGQLPVRSVSISQHKARTVRALSPPDLVFERLSGKGPFFAYLSTLDDVIMSRGGNPLVVGGKIIGAIGVSGGTGSQDDVISLAGVAALK